MKRNKFESIYWFAVGSTAFVLAYILLITFLPIPEANVRFADTALSFLMGTIIGNTFGYLMNTPDQNKPKEDEK